jgi:DNA-binding SARP family transcriptional activator
LAEATVTSELRFGLLGSLEVRRGTAVVPVARSKLRVLLATLLLEPNRTVPFDRITERLWGEDPPPSARSTLHVYAMRLRRALGDRQNGFQLVRTRPNGYLLEIKSDRVDVGAFHQLLERARRANASGDMVGESALLTEALGLWRGPALLDIPSESLQRTVVPRLAEERLQAVERRLKVDLELERHAELVGELAELTREHPTREQFWLLLMHALRRSDRRVEALAAYRNMQQLFRAELGIEPGEAIQRLHRAILAGEYRREPAEPGDAAPSPGEAVAEEDRRVTPSHLPPDIRTFVGRERHLRELTEELAAGGTAGAVPVLILSGSPGVGKTALAVRVAHQVRSRYPDGQLYVNLQGYSSDSPLMPTVVLARFLRALAVPANQIPTDQEDQVSLYRSLLADRRVLVVLDNAAGPSQVRPLLPGQPGCAALVTSRDDLRGLVALDGGRQVTLAALDDTESRAVLTAMIDPTRLAAEPDAVDDLAELCGRLPLALRIAAANLQANPHQRIADYVEALRLRGRLVQLQVPGDAPAAVRAAFDLSYTRLDATTARLFRLLGTVPGPDFAAPTAAALMGCGLPEAEQVLDDLVAANLVFPSAAGRYQFHDLLREYAATRAGEDATSRTAETRLWDFYLHTARAATELLYPDAPSLPLPTPVAGSEPLAITTEKAALDWLDDERPNLVAAALSAAERGRRRYAWQLADSLRGYFWGRGHAVEGLAVCDAALAAARADGDRRAETVVLDAMGLIHFVRSRYETARTFHDEALQISRSTGYLEGQANSLHYLGRVSAQIGPAEQSARYHREALALALRTGNLYTQTLNTTYIGAAHLSAGRADLALQWHMRALELSHRTGNQSVLVRVIGTLANGAWHRGELRTAIALYLECIQLARRTGNRYVEANNLVCLAEVRCDVGEYAQAVADAEEGARLGRALGERRHEIGGAEIITTAQFRGGRSDGIIDDYRRALGEAREINFRFGEISILVALAAAYRAGGDPASAVTHAGQAVRTMSDSGIRGIEGTALVELGHGYLDLGDQRRAAAHLDRALTLARRAGLRLTEARARHVYGLVEWAERGADAAGRHWRAALEIFTQVGAPEAERVRALLDAAAPLRSAGFHDRQDAS